MGALVVFDAARRDHFPDVRIGRLRGEGGAGAEEDREEARLGLISEQPTTMRKPLVSYSAPKKLSH